MKYSICGTRKCPDGLLNPICKLWECPYYGETDDIDLYHKVCCWHHPGQRQGSDYIQQYYPFTESDTRRSKLGAGCCRPDNNNNDTEVQTWQQQRQE